MENALQTASWNGYEEGNREMPFRAASGHGHTSVVQLLIEKGADVNAQGGYYGNALQAASKNGHKSVVQLLIEKGADVNAQGGYHGIPFRLHRGMAMSQWFGSSLIMVPRLVLFSDTGLFASQVWNSRRDM
ncbi:ankyrin repeat-containing domain protein [Mycena latifolia]|nr:ankyrin repeat-containing domain protein [Mycena latifolia]